MRVLRQFEEFLRASARAAWLLGDLLKEQTRIAKSRRKAHKKRAEAPLVVEERSDVSEWDKLADKMIKASQIGGVPIEHVPAGPPADPGPIGP